MRIELNDACICDEILALTALRAVTRPAEASPVLLTRDQLPGLRNMIRMMFAETVISLGSHVESCGMDGRDISPAHPYTSDSGDGDGELTLSLELTVADGVDSGKSLAIKRTLEHIVAAKVLEAVACGSDHEFTDTLRAQYQGATAALRQSVGEAASPTAAIAPRWY